MVNLLKVIKHIRKVGFKQFRQEFAESKEQTLQEPLTALNLQKTGYLGAIAFSIIASIAFFYRGLWYLGALFIFNILIQSGQFLTNRNQIKMFKEMAEAEKEIHSKIEEETVK